MSEPSESKRQQVLAQFGDFVLDHEVLDDILNEGCRLIAKALDVDLAKVIEIERATNTGFVRAGVGWRCCAKWIYPNDPLVHRRSRFTQSRRITLFLGRSFYRALIVSPVRGFSIVLPRAGKYRFATATLRILRRVSASLAVQPPRHVVAFAACESPLCSPGIAVPKM